MIDDPSNSPTILPSQGDRDVFPDFTRLRLSADAGDIGTLSETRDVCETGYICQVELQEGLIQRLRELGELREVQHHDDVPLTPRADPSNQGPERAPASPPGGAPQGAPKNKNNPSDHQQLIARLNKQPHVVQFNGVELDRNERLKIVAAVALCESGHDPFTAENLDSEFHMKRSANLSYGHIVHIGLSYGIIQFTQDSGVLGKLLTKMHDKDPAQFQTTFGDNYLELLKLTTAGVDVTNVDYASGQAHWNQIRSTKEGKALAALADKNKLPKEKEIRGKRVQPIAISVGGPKQDLWEGAWKQRFTDAGKIDVFQEAELEFAVEGYLNPALNYCKSNNIRSATGIAFVVACQIRGAPRKLIVGAAKEKKLTTPFTSGDDERSAVEYISKLSLKTANKLDGTAVQKDEIIRATKLLKDETGFLAEDLYWTDTYTAAYDK